MKIFLSSFRGDFRERSFLRPPVFQGRYYEDHTASGVTQHLIMCGAGLAASCDAAMLRDSDLSAETPDTQCGLEPA